jgi:hypothetical protein
MKSQLEKEMSLLYLRLKKIHWPLLIKFNCQEIGFERLILNIFIKKNSLYIYFIGFFFLSYFVHKAAF